MAGGVGGEQNASATADGFARAHAALLKGKDLQFDPSVHKPPPVPKWAEAISVVVAKLAPILTYVFWGGLILGGVLILYFLGRELIATRWPMRRPGRGPNLVADTWRPTAAKARTLLEDADRLAAEGRFAEAAHLILFRSIEDIESRRPDLIRPALTSRDIAELEGVPRAVRDVFAGIARVVEASFFGGRSVSAEEYGACRKAYEGFAFKEAWR
ncbi:MAG: DUF4129 domain-containing protein [Caulobacter sp.]|nr:DUF4129 domain-containing protein [Caulobacter sp.]